MTRWWLRAFGAQLVVGIALAAAILPGRPWAVLAIVLLNARNLMVLALLPLLLLRVRTA